MCYSNLSFSLLGIALAQNQHKTFSQLMQQEIFTPLKMRSATFAIAKGEGNYELYAQGHDAVGNVSRTPAEGLFGSSWAIKASLQDMDGYLRVAVGEKGSNSTLLAAMRLAQTGYFRLSASKSAIQLGLGWFIVPIEKLSQIHFISPPSTKSTIEPVDRINAPHFNGNSLIDKTGATNGFRSYIGVIPDQHIGVVILTNKFIYHAGAVRDLGRLLLAEMSSVKTNGCNLIDQRRN